MRWSTNGGTELTLAEGSDAERQAAITALQTLAKHGQDDEAATTERLISGLQAGVVQTPALQTLAGWCHLPEGPQSLREPAISASQAMFGFRLPTPEKADPAAFFWRVARKLES